MAYVHGTNTFISVDGDDISAFTDASELNRESDSHLVTGYGKLSKVRHGGLLDSSGSMSGSYFTGATGPRAILEPLIGTLVPLVRRPEGTGTGKPQDAMSVLIKKYTETAPVADMVKWACDFEGSDAVTSTTQA